MKANRVMFITEQHAVGRGSRWAVWDELIATGSTGNIEQWLDFSVRVGCFGRNCERVTRRLSSIGAPVQGAMCVSLLPPMSDATWNESAADAVGTVWANWIFEVMSGRRVTGGGQPTARRVICFGARTTRACLGYDAEILTTHCLENWLCEEVWLLHLPYPNDDKWYAVRDNWYAAYEAMDSFLRLSKAEQ